MPDNQALLTKAHTALCQQHYVDDVELVNEPEWYLTANALRTDESQHRTIDGPAVTQRTRRVIIEQYGETVEELHEALHDLRYEDFVNDVYVAIPVHLAHRL